MLKRLLTAVLVLGLILAFSSTAFTDPTNVPGGKDEAVNLPAYTGKIPSHAMKVPTPSIVFRHTGQRILETGAIPPRPAPAGVDTAACYEPENFSGSTRYRVELFTGTMPDDTDNSLSEMFEVVNYPKYHVAVDRIDAIIRIADHRSAGGTGPGLRVRVRVHDDNMGLPGAVLRSEIFTIPTQVSSGTWFTFTFATPVAITGARYHVSIGYDPAQAADGDRLALWVALNGPHYCSFGASGTWIPLADSWWGTDEDLVLVPHQCEYYASCYNVRTPLGTGAGYIHPMPDNVGWTGGATVNGVGQRFVSGTPETLTQVRVAHYSLPGYYTGTSTNGLVVQIWKDDGTGSIDNTAGPISTTVVPGGAGLFPTTGIGGSGWNYVNVFPSPRPVLTGPWHVTMKTSSDIPTDGQIIFWYSNPTTNPGPSGLSVGMTAPFSPYWQRSYLNADWGFDAGNNVRVYLCKDEFSVCRTGLTYDMAGSFTSFMTMQPCFNGTGGYRKAVGQRVSAGKFNKVSKIRFRLISDGTFWEPDVLNTKPDVKVQILASVAGVPGAEIWSTVVPGASLGSYPGWTEVVIPGGSPIIVNDFFVAWTPLFVNATDQVWLSRERESANPAHAINGGYWVRLCQAIAPGGDSTSWFANTAVGGLADNACIEADFCSIPPDRWTCTTPSDFMTAGADYARDGHTSVPLSDAYCDLSFKWKYTDPLYNVATNRINNSGPVVYDTFVVCGFASRYRFLSLNDGHVIGEITGPGAPYYLPSSGMNCVPTIAMVPVGGTPKPIMYVGSGNSSGYRVFSAYDLSSWTGTAPTAVPTQLFSINAGNYGAMGYTFPATPMPQHIGATNYTTPIVLTIGTTPMVFFNTNDQYVWAANAATGVRIWGPIIIGGLTYHGMATDGTNLYISNAALPPGYDLGDISCWDAATGAAKWKLSTAAGGGLRGAAIGEDFVNEEFVDGLAYFDNTIFAVSSSRVLDNPTGNPGGVLYRINATNGAVLTAVLCNQYRQDGGLAIQSLPMIDANMIVLAGGSRWVPNNSGRQLFGFNRFTSALVWQSLEGNATDPRHFNDGLLTCETGETDLGFIANSKGFLTCFNPVTGEDIFSRRFARASGGASLAMSNDGDLLVGDRNGQIVCLSKAVANRPRLEIVNYTPQGNTYGPLNQVFVTIPGVYANTGCAPLTGTINLLTASNGSPLTSVPAGAAQAASIADQLTENSGKMMSVAEPAEIFGPDATADQRPALNGAALATPPFFNVGTLPVSLNPGQVGDLVLDVHQSLVYRGENVFYAEFVTNDNDYFIDSVGGTRIYPQVRGMIVGGCLLDTATLHFGTGADLAAVLNVPRYGHWGEVDNATWMFQIGGDHADFYGGFLIYGVSERRIAMNTQDWWTGNGESRAYKSLQADPNACTINCKPALLASQTFGLITATGAAYTPLTGNLICRTYLDSVQMWAPIDTTTPSGYGAWNWDNTWLTAGTYNNDSTMGLITQSRSIGFTGYPAEFPFLGNVMVDFMKTYLRYANSLPLTSWRIGEFIDYDLGGDTILHYPNFSPYSTCVSVGTGTRTTGLYGTIKLPYGGGCNSEIYPTLRNAVSMDGNQSMNSNTSARGNLYFDSVYSIMGRPTGSYSQGSMVGAAGDQRSHDSWLIHDFASNQDTLQFAIAHFGHHTIADPRVPATIAAPLSTLLNKWVGMDRGDVNNDGAINLADVVYLADYAAYGSATATHPGPIPFPHVGDVNADTFVNGGDVTYLTNYYFYYGACPMSKYIAY